MENTLQSVEKQVQAMGSELRSMTSLGEVERTLLPLLRDHFDASLVVFYLFGRGPLEILHLGGLTHLQDDILKFHSAAGARWLKKACMKGPILRDRCAMTAEEFENSPFRSVVQGSGSSHSRGLVISAKGETLGMVVLFRSSRQVAFEAHHDSLLLTYAAPLSDLMERLISHRVFASGANLPLEPLNHLEEGMAFYDEDLRLTHANDSGWLHLKKVSRRSGSWLSIPSPLLRQLRLVREFDRGAEQWATKPGLTPVLLQDENTTEIRFRTFAGQNEGRAFYYTISSMIRTLPAASVDQVAKRMGLTPREREVCAHLVEGKRNRDIANTFGITEHTVKIHVRRVLGKFKAHSRSEIPGAVLKALTYWDGNTPSSE
jgi:DNA-binding CsgD family transcriptional regulator